MRNLLRNKFTVGVLAVVAVYSIVHQFRAGMGDGVGAALVAARQSDSGQGSLFDATGLGASELKVLTGTNNLADLRHTLGLLATEYPSGGEVRRDPFSREILHHSPSETVEAESELAAPEIPLKLELQALSIHSRASFAVVNGRIVGAGDRLGPFEIESVMAEGVWLKGTNGRQCLKMDYLTPLKKNEEDPESATKP